MPEKVVLPFRLKVAGSDRFSGLNAVSTSFRFHGMLRLDAAALLIEWVGSARVQEVGALTVRDEQLSLPSETLAVPVERLRAVELAGGWWRPRLEISATDFHTLATVPSEEWGKVRFWYARRDRARAAALARDLHRAIFTTPPAGDDGPGLQSSTPPSWTRSP